MAFQKQYFDLVLVSGSLLIMFAYNLFHLYMYHNHPKTTELGFENQKKKSTTTTSDVSVAISVTGSNIAAATQLAIISLTLCTLIGAWTAYSSKNLFQFQTDFIYGDTSQFTISIKCISLLTCFLLAFSCFVQSVKHLTFSSYLMSNPFKDHDNVEDVVKEVKRAGEFWLLGLRALYFALNFLVWFFGPIPMLVSTVLMMMILFCHDTRDPRKLIITKISKRLPEATSSIPP
ncbi:uncharacterized protein LOC142635225 [Castanea sativa]|uniref:uncharacterized protein LOC142635225 n=1 Tax=Castanea sativa TaxID=21020 RepID=UPI003F64A0F8